MAQENQFTSRSSANRPGDLGDMLADAIAGIFRTLEPQINDLSGKFAAQAVDKGRDLVTTAYSRARKQPWYLVGIAAVLLVGAAVYLGFGERNEFEGEEYTH